MELLKDTVKSVMADLKGKRRGPDKAGPDQILKRCLTKKELRHIKFNYFKKGIISINVDSSGWLYQLSLDKESLKAKLQQELKTLKDIHLRIGQVKNRS